MAKVVSLKEGNRIRIGNVTLKCVRTTSRKAVLRITGEDTVVRPATPPKFQMPFNPAKMPLHLRD